MNRRALFCLIAWLGLAPTALAAAPTHFEQVFGGALLCRDEIDPAYFKNYLATFFKNSYKTEGGAYWFKPDPKQTLFGLKPEDIFVSTGDSRYSFVGVVFKEKLADARKKLAQTPGVTFLPFEDALRSSLGAFLVEYNRKETKLYCVKYRDY